MHFEQHPPVCAIESRNRACSRERARESKRLGRRFRLILIDNIDRAGGFALTERQMRAELVGERPHCRVLRACGDAQLPVALCARFRDQLPEQETADAAPPRRSLHAECDLRKGVRRLLWRVQFGRSPHYPVLEVGDNDRAIVGAFFGIALNEAVVDEAMKAIIAARSIKPQKMIAQQGQFFVLAERPYGTSGS